MADEKKLVIKINYPNQTAKLPEDDIPVAEYATEWNIKRLAGALVLLCVLVAVGLFQLGGEDETNRNSPATDIAVPLPDKTETVVQAGNPEKLTETASQSVVLDSNETHPEMVNEKPAGRAEQKSAVKQQAAPESVTGLVVRGRLAYGLKGKEPVGDVQLPLMLGSRGERTLYYFTELQDMSGKLIYHEWLYKGKSVFKRPIKITDSHWRTATHKTIRSNALGDWTVQVTDANGAIMQKIDFNVAAAN